MLQRLRDAPSLLVVTHARPDGDALGSMAGLIRSARLAGRKATGLTPTPPPQRYDFLFPDDPPAAVERFDELADAAERVVILDTCSFSQLDGLEASLRARRDRVVVIDHHATTDDVGSARWVDTSAAAAGVLVGELIAELGWPMDPAVAECLMTAVTTDTGWLRFANTDARALHQVGRYIEAGVRPDQLYQKLFQTDRAERLMLTVRMLESLEIAADGQLAAMVIRQQDFADTGARPEETENLVNEALRIKTVETAMLLVEMPDCVRVSLRSRDLVNVAEVARRFGGGGHARAAGLRLQEDIDTLKDKLMSACAEELARR